jgi:hypothetical protein
VFPNSVETGVAQLAAGTTSLKVGSISFTVSIKFDLRPSMCERCPPRVPHDAFGVGYGAGVMVCTTSLRFDIPGGPPEDRFGALARISSI